MKRAPTVPSLLLGLLLSTIAAAACATSPGDPLAGRAPGPAAGEPSPDLPPIPEVTEALELRVSYPRDSAFIATRARNFIFGSAGHRDARVWINGQEVDVQPNGGFLAFLPVPADSVYRLRATLGDATDTLRVPIRLPAPTPAPGDSLLIVAGSAYPAGAWAALPGERIDVGFRGTAGATARLRLPDGSVIPLVERRTRTGGATEFEIAPADDTPGPEEPREADLAWYRGFFTAQGIVTPDTTISWPGLSGPRPPAAPADTAPPVGPPPPADTPTPADTATPADDPPPVGPPMPLGLPDTAEPAGPRGPAAGAVLELARAGDTVRAPLPFNLALLDPERPRVATAADLDPPDQNGDRAIPARPGPGGGPYHYIWQNGTELTLTGERNGIYRIRLAEDLDAWSPAGDIQLLMPGTPPPGSRVATVRMDPQPGYVDVHVALDRRLPYQVEETDRSVRLIVFGAVSRANFLQHGRVDPYIERGEWSQATAERFVLEVHTRAAPWGYEIFWGPTDDLVLRLRRPPTITSRSPLRGLTVGVDAGHGGADRATMGPTGFTEADANLAIALALRDELEDRGANVVMTRTTDTTVALVERTDLARARDVDLWVSIHNNAFPDGVNPWENSGTSVYYNHPRAASLAWSVHRELLAELGLRDLGVGRADFHQARFTWAPSILTENMFMMIPEHEAALRTESVPRRIAEAHVRGIERWLRSYGADRDPPD